ncbi:MAG: hypothetical protein HY079_01530, partial [Elusimicrobia bacterium]|nr:hypothetical protein [Elusimicrobiota bacterium]
TIHLAALALAVAFAAPSSAATRGFVVFTDTATYDWTLAGGSVTLAATGPRRDPEDHLACAGRVYGIESFGRAVYRLGPGLAVDRRAETAGDREGARLLGCDGTRLYAFAGNAVLAYDADLSTPARVALDSGAHDGIVPVLYPDQFLVFEGRAYLYASNAGQIHVVDLAAGTARRLAFDRGEDSLKMIWVDPDARALVALAEREGPGSSEGLEEGESRRVKSDAAYTFDLRDLSKPPRVKTVHEERIVHKPYPPDFWEHIEKMRAQGMIVDFRPEDRPDGERGTQFLRLSPTVPAYAEASVYDAAAWDSGFGGLDLGVARADGRFEPVERQRDPATGAVWFERGGKAWVTRTLMREKRVELLPAAVNKLLERGVGRAYGDRILAY